MYTVTFDTTPRIHVLKYSFGQADMFWKKKADMDVINL